MTLGTYLRESYLEQCLREFAQAYRQGAYATREEYLAARRAERALHQQQWEEEDAESHA